MMKKWFAGVLAMALCLMGAVAAAECAHETTVKWTKTTDEVYAEADNETHLHTFTITIQTYCQKCRRVIKESVGGPFEAVERHNWTGEGSCLQCGKKNTCQHTNTEELRRKKGTTATDLGDGLHHHVVAEAEIKTYCSDCGIQIGDSRTETQEYDEAHTLKYGCWDCGYEAECPHEGETYENVRWVDSRYEKLDEDTHTIYGKTKTTVYCRDCEEQLSTAESETEQLLDTESHDWYNDTCWDCGFERSSIACEHSDTVVKLKEVYDQYYGCVEVNSTSHEQTIVYAEINCCADCGEEIGEILSFKKVVRIEDHNYSTDYHYICEGCGYKNTCTHDGATHTVVKKGDCWDAISIDENTHKVDCVAYRYTYCDQCGAKFSEEQLGRQWLAEEHGMDGDECIECDYQIACPHENTVKQLKLGSDYLYCNSISDNAHSAVYHLYQYDYCEDCDTLLDNYDSTYAGVKKVNEPHNMVNHRCVECGYCEHPEEQIETTSQYLRYECVVYDEFSHESSSQLAYTSTCQLCGEVVKEWTGTDYVQLSEHWYDEEGVCNNCGYVNTCKHENAYRVMTSQSDVEYQNIDDPVQHKEIRCYYSEMSCPDCLMTWDRQLSDVVEEGLSKHSFRSKTGTCRSCGYVNICTHENTELLQSEGGFCSEYIDEKYHARYQDEWNEWVRCVDCRQTLSESTVQGDPVLIVAKEEHSFNRLGVCSCGYENPCKHTNTMIGKIDSSYYYLQCDDTHHERVNVITKGEICADCGEELSVIEKKEEVSTYEKHWYNDFGVCSKCYHVNTCKHKQTWVNREYFVHNCVIVNDTQHEIEHGIREEEICLSCGEVLREEFLETVTEQQPHDGEDTCSLCGWRMPTHVCTWELENSRTLYSANAIDALTHEAVVQYGSSWYCDECGDGRAGIPQPVETIVEAHNFTDLGRCTDCGYVNFCEHEETYTVQKPVFTPTYQMKDDAEHTYTASMRIETRCATCDQRLSYTAALNAECTEEHAFDSVADLLCDLCGYEKEQPEEAPTPEPTPTATPEPTNTPAPTKNPGSGSSGGSGGSGSSSGTKPSKPRETATPTPEELMPKTGDTSLPVSVLLLTMAAALCGIAQLAKKKKAK